MRRAALLLAALAAAGCAGPPPPRTTPDLERGLFTIGYAAASAEDRALARSAALAVEEVNAAGGVGGAVRLELLIDSEGGEPAEAARRLVLAGVQVLVLACDPAAQRAQAEVAERTQVLAFAPCNEDPRIPQRYGIVWPVSLGANAEAAALADHALAQRYASFRAVGVRGRMRGYLTAAAASRGIDVVTAGGDAVLGTHLVEQQELPDGVAFTAYGFPSPGSAAAEWWALHERKVGSPPAASSLALGYDAVRVIAAAIEAAGTPDPFRMAERLASGLTVQGAFGEITYPGSGERQPETAVAVVEVSDGRRVLVEKSLPEDIPPP